MQSVYLFDILDGIPADSRTQLRDILNGYFEKLADAKMPGKTIPKMTCSWSSTEPNPVTNLDILIYFLPFGKSVARKKYPDAPSSIAGHDGLTVGGDPRISEVYLHTSDMKILANLAFHEIMHMKLKKGNEMHTMNGLAAQTVTDQTKLTPQNINSMAPALLAPVNQWTEGVKILLNVKSRKASGDPMADILE